MKELILVLGLAGGFISGWHVCFYRMRKQVRVLNATVIRLRNQQMRVPPVSKKEADWRFASGADKRSENGQ